MRAEGIWKDRKQRLPRVYQPRYCRASLGELIQIDGCEHWWFEDRGPQCTLLAFVDDATSRIMHARFVATESTFDYFRATRAYLERYGKPVAFYSDTPRHLPGQQQGGSGRRRHDPVRPRARRTHYRDHLCQRAPIKGSGRTLLWHAAGQAGEGPAAGRD